MNAADPAMSPTYSEPSRSSSVWASDVTVLVYIAIVTVVVHFFSSSSYGFHRDELATLEDARHLAWGYVAYPPVTPFFARLSLELFGTSVTGFRIFAAIAQAINLVVTGLMAREMGGRRGAQLIAAAAYLPICLVAGSMMQYVSFDNLFWVLTAYFVVKLLRTDDPRWWVGVGASIGLGMMSKYGIAFLVAGVVVAVLVTPLRRHLASKWLWIGVAVSLAVFLPNLIWEARHGFITLEFLRNIHARDIRIGRTKDFLPDQLKITLFATPLWLGGLWSVFSSFGKRFRAIGWMYVVPLALFVVAKGRGYYMIAAYPMLYAAGAVWGECWLATLRSGWKVTVRAVAWAALCVQVAMFSALMLPLAPPDTRLGKLATNFSGDLREEIGWPELVQTVAQIRDKLPQHERLHLGILAGNYGEAGAINLYGPQYGLPQAISGINSFWQRGYGNPPPETLIVVGLSRRFVDNNFSQCELAAHPWNRYGVMNEETHDHPETFVCRGLKRPWPEFWKNFRYFG